MYTYLKKTDIRDKEIDSKVLMADFGAWSSKSRLRWLMPIDSYLKKAIGKNTSKGMAVVKCDN